MKKLFLIFTVFIFCNVEVCIAQRSIQNDLMGGLNYDGEKTDNYVQNLQASKKEWEKILSELRLKFAQHRSSSRPSYTSQEEWDREEFFLIKSIEDANRNISLLNKQINEAKKQEDAIQKALEKAFQEAENQRKEQEYQKELQQKELELQEAINKKKVENASKNEQQHQFVDDTNKKAQYGNNALNRTGSDNAEGFVSTRLLNLDSENSVPQRTDISSKFQQRMQKETANPKSDDEIQALLKQIEELKRQVGILERQKQAREKNSNNQ